MQKSGRIWLAGTRKRATKDRRQKQGEPDIYSFAAITNDPPSEVAATGHNHCIIPLNPQNLSAWFASGATARCSTTANVHTTRTNSQGLTAPESRFPEYLKKDWPG
jgi:hypothetical protein